MSNGTPPITDAPVPPSIAGIVQPVIVAGGESLPPSFPLGTAGTWLPPPQVGMGGDAPFPTPVVSDAPSPPSVAGYPQPQFGSGSATAPTAASLFPAFTTSPPLEPIVMVTDAPPPPIPLPLPTTPGVQPVTISTAPNIPQLPWAA